MTDQAKTTVSDEIAREIRNYANVLKNTGACTEAYINRITELSELSARRATADVTEAMVERAAKAMWDRSGNDWTWDEAVTSIQCERSVEWTRDDARAALRAAAQQAPE